MRRLVRCSVARGTGESCSVPAHLITTTLAILVATIILQMSVHAQETPAEARIDGWSLLWENRLEEAIGSFESALESNDKDLSARRGLTLALLTQGHERQAVESVFQLGKIKEAGTIDYLLAQWVYMKTMTHGRDEKEFQKLSDRLAKRKEIDPLDRRAILTTAAHFALSNGDAKRAKKIAEKLNRVDRWSILGPFDNTSGSGHSKSHLQGVELTLQDRYMGKAGQEFHWHNPTILGLLREVNFDNHFVRSQAITAYAGTDILLESPGTYLLSVSKVGALAVELDGKCLIDLDKETSQSEYYHFEIDLPEGAHSLLVKVSGEDLEPQVSAALSSVDGKTPEGVTFRPLVPGRIEPRDVTYRFRPLPMVTQLMERATADSTDPSATYLYMIALILFDLDEEVREFVSVAERRFPSSVVMRRAIASAYFSTDDEDEWRDQMRMAVDLDPENPLAVHWDAQEFIRRKLYSQSDSLLVDLTERYPGFPRALVTLLNSYRERGLVDKVVPLAERLIARYPDYSIPYGVLADHYEALDPARSRSYRKKAVDRSARASEIYQLLMKAAEKDDVKELVKQIEELFELFPDAPTIGTQLAATRLRSGSDKGIALIERLADAFPYSYEAQYMRAAVAELMIPYDTSEKKIAIRHYRRALALRPGDFDTRDKLRSLTDLMSVSEILPPIDLEKRRATAPEASDYPGAEACVLADQRRRILFADGSTFAERALMIKVFNDDGVQRFGSIHTGVNPLFSDLTIREARTLKADGGEVEAQTLFGEVAFQSLAPGDIIELHYHSSSWSVGKLNQDYWDSHFFRWTVPCLHSSYSLLAPPERDFQWKMHNHDAPETIMESKQHGDFTLYSWKMEEIPARSPEVHAPPSRDVSPWLDVSTINAWDRIVEWYADLSEEPSGRDPQIGRKVKDLLGESETGDIEAGEADARHRQIATLYDFVANQVAYENLSFQYSAYIPEPAGDVLRSMYGDCKDKTCLLRSMLDEIGVESNFALVTPVTMGMREHLPSPRFNHVVLAVPSENGAGYWFLDPTAKGAPAANLPEALQGAKTLVIRKDEIDLVSIPFSTSAGPSLSVVTEAQIESGSDMTMKREETIRSADGVATIRSEYASADDEKRSKLLTADLGRQNVGLELLGCTWNGLEPGVDSVRISYELRLREAVSKSGNLRLTKLPWRSSIDERFSMVIASATREEPLLLYGLRLHEDESLRLALPEGWRVEGAPESRTIESDFGSYTVSYSSGGGSVNAHRTLQIAGSHVPPERYPEFKRFLEEVIREQDLVLVLRSGG